MRVMFMKGGDHMRKVDVNLEIGKQYGDYIVVRYSHTQSNTLYFEFECKVCKRHHIMALKDVKQGYGCYHKSCIRTLPKNETTKRLRNTWSHMVDRCTNPNCQHYKSYGGRGIKCDYKLFIDFYDDFAKSYIEFSNEHGVKDTTIERIDVNKDYTKSNMKWETWSVQYKNKRWPKYKATKDGVEYIGTSSELAEIIGCKRASISEVAKGRVNKVYGYGITRITSND